MNESEILSLTFELKEEIMKSEKYIDLKKKEQEMMKDEECLKLLSMYQLVQDKYNEAKRFEKYGSDLSSVQKELSDIKYKVDENKKVKAYNEVYKEVSKEIKRIEKILFKDIIKEKKEIVIEEK